MSQICLPEIYAADGFGIILILCVFSGWKSLRQSREKKILQMMLCVFISCAADIVSFSVDGKTGSFFRMLNYVSNLWLYIANPVMEVLWVKTLALHINGYVSRLQNILIKIIIFLCAVLIVMNFFSPVLFSIDEHNVYSRGPFFWLFNIFAVVFILDSLVIYVLGKINGSVMKFFPVALFLVPVVFGIFAQGFFYGIAAIWPSVSICVVCLILGLQNHNLITDKLTGLFNRFYLDRLKEQLVGKKAVTVMMLDMNGFKRINDTFGHSEGDNALVAIGQILREAVGNKGAVLRYAGDEFVIVINSDKEDGGKNVEKLIHKKVDEYNRKSKKFYKISVSIGRGIFDFSYNSLDYVLHVVDEQMYANKKSFYQQKGIQCGE